MTALRYAGDALVCGDDDVGGAVGLEVGVALLEEEEQLFDHAADVVAVDEREAQLHGASAKLIRRKICLFCRK